MKKKKDKRVIRRKIMKKLLTFLMATTVLASSFAITTTNAVDNVEPVTNGIQHNNSDIFDYSVHTSADGLYRYEYIEDKTGGVSGIRILEHISENQAYLKIPGCIDDYSVQEIAEGSFKNDSTLEKIVISDYMLLNHKSFKNCENLKYAELSEYVELQPKAIGYYKDKKTKGFTITCNSKNNFENNYNAKTPVYYAYDNCFKCNYNVKSTCKKTIKYKSGVSFKILVDNQTATNWKSSDSKIAKITENGKITLLKKGKVTLTAKLKNGKSYSRKLEVTSNPMLSKNSKKISTIYVRNGKTRKLKIIGKANSTNNIYKNTKYAKITSKKSANTITLKGIKKGTTILKIKVNGVVLRLKVNVI